MLYHSDSSPYLLSHLILTLSYAFHTRGYGNSFDTHQALDIQEMDPVIDFPTYRASQYVASASSSHKDHLPINPNIQFIQLS